MELGPMNVLCIEEHASDFLSIKRALMNGGLLGNCERVDSREGLTAALAESPWDLALSDYAVPGMYFTDILRRFVHHYPELPLILVSDTIGEVKASVMVEIGAWDYVPKAGLTRRLVPAIERAMRRVAVLGGRHTASRAFFVSPAVEPRPR